MGKRLTLEDAINKYQNETREILDIEVREYGNKGQKITYIKYKCLSDSYEGWMSNSNMSAGYGCPKCAGSIRLTIEEVKERLKIINPNIEIMSTEYKNAHTKLKCLCLIDGYKWEAKWNSLSQGNGCARCSKNEILTLDKVKLRLKDINPNIEILSTEYVNNGTKLRCKCLIDGYEWSAPWRDLGSGQGCPECGGRRIWNTQEIIEKFKEVHGDKYLYDKVEFINGSTKVLIGCKIEGHGYFEQAPDSHRRGSGCPICLNRKTNNTNSIRAVRPDLIKYFKYENESDEYTEKSGKRVILKCPYCNTEKEMVVRKLSEDGFSCPMCSDKISIPEKFGIYLLKQLNINFKTQYNTDWTNNKRYDFYFIFNNEQYIIETHGMQHYEETSKYSKFKMSLKEQQENDLLKYNLAIDNGIEPNNYIVVDCRYSEFEWLKENFTKSLQTHFDLSNIDWLQIWENCQSSLLFEICNIWNNKKEHDTINSVFKDFYLTNGTIGKYLKIGTELELCYYNAKEENFKGSSRAGKMKGFKVYQYSEQGHFIKVWDSLSSVARELCVSRWKISNNCDRIWNNFIWSLNPPNENNMYTS